MVNWRSFSKCKELSTTQSDSLFFPPPGGKPKKAARFCETCPVINQCLTEALSPGIVGFWAGTTETERKGMRRFRTHVKSLVDSMPKEPVRRSVRYRPIVRTLPTVDPLADIDGPSLLEELTMIKKAS